MGTNLMFQDYIEDNTVFEAYKQSTKNIIGSILEKGYPFSVIIKIKFATFSPELPKEISKNFNDITMFALDGYTLNSANINGDNFEFEAGFGSNNFGSVVSLPIATVAQILIEDMPVFINPCEYQDIEKQNKDIEKSTNVFLSNPNNKKFLT